MVKTSRAVLIPVWVAFMAAALLLGFMLRPAPVSAPVWNVKQVITAPASSPAQTTRTVARSGSTSFSAPPAATLQSGDEAPVTPGSPGCPTKPGVSMPCTRQR